GTATSRRRQRESRGGNARRETGSLRVTISAPSGIAASGARYAAQPTAAVAAPATGPPESPNQSTQARKTPAAMRPRPTSSGWWWLRAAPRRRFRAGDLPERFLGAMRPASRVAADLLLGQLSFP